MSVPSHMKLTAMVRDAAERIRAGAFETAKAEALALEQAGIVENVHVGRDDLSPREIIEWYAGQLIDIVNNEAWFAMNSWLNCVDKFVPKVD